MRTDGLEYFAEFSSESIFSNVEGRTLIWPIGGVEQHGPHLPLNVDTIIPEAFAKALALDCKGIILPVQPLSVRSLPQSGGGLQFPGTLFVDGCTFVNYLADTLKSLSSLPFGQIVIINGHYENEGFIFEALDRVRGAGAFGERSVLAFSWWSMVSNAWVADNLPDFPGWHAEHAGITETSLMMHLRPELVSPERPDHEHPPQCGVYRLPFAPESSTRGVLSKTSGSSARIGELIFDHVRQAIRATVIERA